MKIRMVERFRDVRDSGALHGFEYSGKILILNI